MNTNCCNKCKSYEKFLVKDQYKVICMNPACPFCHTHPASTNKDWRKNIHATLQALNKGWENGIPLLVINAIDAAYVAGLEDNTAAQQKGRAEERERIRAALKNLKPKAPEYLGGTDDEWFTGYWAACNDITSSLEESK